MLKHSVFVDLFAGTAPVSKYLRRKGYACIAFDKLQGPQFDLGRREVVLTIAGWLRAGLVWALWFATPCITTTRARTDRSGRMPPPLRSSEHYRGLPDLSASHRAQVREANSLIDSGGRLQQLAWDLGICCGEENPQTSILWCFPSRRRALARGSVVDVDFCAAGGPMRKRTKLVFQHCGTVEAPHLRCHGRGGLCSFTGRKHVHIRGKMGGKWLSKVAEPYPPEIFKFIGDVLIHVVHRRAVATLSQL